MIERKLKHLSLTHRDYLSKPWSLMTLLSWTMILGPMAIQNLVSIVMFHNLPRVSQKLMEFLLFSTRPNFWPYALIMSAVALLVPSVSEIIRIENPWLDIWKSNTFKVISISVNLVECLTSGERNLSSTTENGTPILRILYIVWIE